jgi:hypothetical protein
MRGLHQQLQRLGERGDLVAGLPDVREVSLDERWGDGFLRREALVHDVSEGSRHTQHAVDSAVRHPASCCGNALLLLRVLRRVIHRKLHRHA